MLHWHDGKADCSDVLYIFSVRMSVYHGWATQFELMPEFFELALKPDLFP